MKITKIIFPSIVFIAYTFMASGQDITRAVDLFEAGMYQAAQKHFLKNPSAGSNYYLGEIAFANKKPDSAAYYYDLGLADDSPYLLCNVGKGKLLLATDAKAAEGLFKAVFTDKASKKNPAIYTAIGRAYAANKMGDKAAEYFAQAHSVNKN
jgi:tetratricopeptide (TPR) repeat protein